jgi:hypothetical protein
MAKFLVTLQLDLSATGVIEAEHLVRAKLPGRIVREVVLAQVQDNVSPELEKFFRAKLELADRYAIRINLDHCTTILERDFNDKNFFPYIGMTLPINHKRIFRRVKKELQVLVEKWGAGFDDIKGFLSGKD